MTTKNLRVIYLCNAVDQETKNERDVRYDSPAATNKVFGIAHALQTQEVDIHVLSLGRGKQTGSHKRFSAFSKIVNDTPVHFAAFWHYPILTHIVGAFSLASQLKSLTSGYSGKTMIIAYNRFWHYLPALFQAKLRRIPCILDLEDGTIRSSKPLTRLMDQFSKFLFGYLCNYGAMLAGKALINQVTTDRIFVCYGCSEQKEVNQDKWFKRPIQILFGGSLLYETGAQLLLDTISLLEKQAPELSKKIHIKVTGYGSMAEQLEIFANTTGKNWITYLGNVDRQTYLNVIDQSHIGLCLKLSSSEMGKTTFPSKILEYASFGLGIITTKVSDVPELLDQSSAILLDEDTPDCLADALHRIAQESFDAKDFANKTADRVNSICNSEIVGTNLIEFVNEGFTK